MKFIIPQYLSKIYNDEKRILFASVSNLPPTCGHAVWVLCGNSDYCIAEFSFAYLEQLPYREITWPKHGRIMSEKQTTDPDYKSLKTNDYRGTGGVFHGKG